MLSAGTKLGLFEIQSPLGAGGMGEVYRARDTRLDRIVAIKALPDAFAQDADRLARFEREAKLLASLNHPNIAGIYGVEDVGGRSYLVLECVEGATLTERIASGPLAIDETVDIARQMALALEAAHDAGIIHRDLKPANVKITAAGQVKVLDFGLAKGTTGATSGTDLSNSPTLTNPATMAGVILGTAAYMSPEQARGRTVDRRTDIWSFGCVLFEMLAQSRPFGGETVPDIIARILQNEPGWASLPPATPARLRDLLRRCLEKDPKRRQRDIGDARLELEDAATGRETSESKPAIPAVSPRPRRAVLAIVGVLSLVTGVVLGAGLWRTFGSTGSSTEITRVALPFPADLKVLDAAATPDGRVLVLVAQPRSSTGGADPVTRLYVRPVDREEALPLAGTDGVQAFVLPENGRWIYFVAPLSRDTPDRKLARVPIDGTSPPITVTNWKADWALGVVLDGGDIIVTTTQGRGLVRLRPSGEVAATVTIDDEKRNGQYFLVRPLPGGQFLLADVTSYDAHGWQTDVGLVDPVTGKARTLVRDGGNARYLSTGHLVFSRAEALFATRFNEQTSAVIGDPVAVGTGLRTRNSWSHGLFHVFRDETLAYFPGGVAGAQRRLSIVDRRGAITPWSTDRRPFELPPAVSRDGSLALVVIPNARKLFEIWLSQRDRPGMRRFAAAADADMDTAVWSPDGGSVAFSRLAENSQDGIYLQDVNGSREPRLLLARESQRTVIRPLQFLPDGSALLFVRIQDGKSDVMMLPNARTGEPSPKPRPLLAGPFSETSAAISPDGRWIAYTSDELGKADVYAAPLSAGPTVGSAIPVSIGGGNRPQWAADSGSLIFVDSRGRLMACAAPRRTGERFGAPVEFLDLTKYLVSPYVDYAPLPDGSVLLIQKGEEEEEFRQLNLVQNWKAELKAKLAAAERARP